MPIFTFTYGSFGDISQCIQLLWKIGKELHDTTGSSSEYQALKGELVQTVQILNGIQLLKTGPQTSQETQGHLAILLAQAADCHKAIVTFLNRRKKPKGLWQIASWHTLGTTEAKELQELLSRGCARLTMLLEMYNQSHQEDRTRYEVARLHRSMENLSNRMQDVAVEVSREVASVGQQIERTYASILEIKRVLENGVKEMTKVEARITLIDPLGQHFPIPISFCFTYAMMRDMIYILAKHKGLAGRSFIEKGRFELVHSKERQGVIPALWSRRLEHGVTIEVSIVIEGATGHQCPHCQTFNIDCKHNQVITCASCRRDFHYIMPSETLPCMQEGLTETRDQEHVNQFRLITVRGVSILAYRRDWGKATLISSLFDRVVVVDG